jgi:nanoRNase/pAp phosphatase (c-di-AMP/oligoRNAs hydrolase)
MDAARGSGSVKTGNDQQKNRLKRLREVLDGAGSMLIVLQDNPDPDAIGAAVGLRRLANELASVQCSIACGGRVGRAENRALIEYLSLNLRKIGALAAEDFDRVALVDTQPGQGNQSLPAQTSVDIVIDHHQLSGRRKGVRLWDVRSRYGSTSTMVWEYMRAGRIEPGPQVATALLYGIRSDTQDLGREAVPADMEAYGKLYFLANKRALAQIQRGQVPSGYFRLLKRGLDRARLCGHCIFCDLGRADAPEMIAEVADLLLRHERAQWSLVWGLCGRTIHLSLRTSDVQISAGDVMKQLIGSVGSGGGHQQMAGGQIPLGSITPTARRQAGLGIRDRYLDTMHCAGEPVEDLT